MYKICTIFKHQLEFGCHRHYWLQSWFPSWQVAFHSLFSHFLVCQTAQPNNSLHLLSWCQLPAQRYSVSMPYYAPSRVEVTQTKPWINKGVLFKWQLFSWLVFNCYQWLLTNTDTHVSWIMLSGMRWFFPLNLHWVLRLLNEGRITFVLQTVKLMGIIVSFVASKLSVLGWIPCLDEGCNMDCLQNVLHTQTVLHTVLPGSHCISLLSLLDWSNVWLSGSLLPKA